MFWSGNYIAVRELNSLLKDKNVTLCQVLEADDVLQECKADNKALIQFLTRPDVLAELVTLITEEPPKNVELSLQYRHAMIACEVLTSQLPTLSDRLSMDTVQMHRLCDFLNREPPLNPLLASYFSKTIEMLLDRSPKQDWYLYHIVCLRVLDFLKARRDFLPNLLRHLHTSAVLDALKCFIRLNDLFNKHIMEWLEEHQFLESLIAIICGTYEPPPLAPREVEKGQQEESEKDEKEGVEKGDLDAHDKEVREKTASELAAGDKAASEAGAEAEADALLERAAERLRAVAAANAASLLTDIILHGCVLDYSQVAPSGNVWTRTAQALVARVTSARGVDSLLQGMFTSPAPARRHALVHGARLLLAMRPLEFEQSGSESSTRGGVELAVAPHLPLLHTALLQPPEPYMHEPSSWEAPTDGGGGGRGRADDVVTTEVRAPERGGEARAAEDAEKNCDNQSDATPAVDALNPTPTIEVATDGPNTAVPATDVPTVPTTREPTTGVPTTGMPTTEEPKTEVTTIGEPKTGVPTTGEPTTGEPKTGPRMAVGAARIQVAALLAALCGSEVDEVASTMLTLGTPGVLIDMMFQHPHNNFLHAHVLCMVRNALNNGAHRTRYARHILEECDLFNRLMDVYDENETKRGTARCPRSGYMGHVVILLRTIAPLIEERAPEQQRWASSSIHSLIQRLDTPLGGYYPSENTYEVETEGMVEVETRLYNQSHYNDYETEDDINEVASSANMNKFLELSNQRMCDQSDMWDDAPEGEEDEREREREREDDKDDDAARAAVHDVLAPVSPWESSFEDTNMAGEGWAQFSADAFGAPVDPFTGDVFVKSDAFANDAFASDAFANEAFGKDAFAKDAFNKDAFTKDAFSKDGSTPFANDSFGENAASEDFTPFWGYQDKRDDANGTSGVEQSLQGMRLDALDKPMDELSSSLADNLRTAMSSMTPEVIANIVNANMTPALDVPLDAANASADATNASNEASNASTAASNASNDLKASDASNDVDSPRETSEKVSDSEPKTEQESAES